MFSTTMFAKEKADELVNKYKEFVHGYVGSSMLTNTEYPEQIISQAKKCALIAVEIAVTDLAFVIPKEAFKFWEQVKLEIETM